MRGWPWLAEIHQSFSSFSFIFSFIFFIVGRYEGVPLQILDEYCQHELPIDFTLTDSTAFQCLSESKPRTRTPRAKLWSSWNVWRLTEYSLEVTFPVIIHPCDPQQTVSLRTVAGMCMCASEIISSCWWASAINVHGASKPVDASDKVPDM